MVYAKQQSLLEEIKQRLEDNRVRIQQAANKGLVTELERVAADTAKNAVESRLQTISQQKNQQRQRLNRVLGLKPDAIIELQQTSDLTEPVKIPSYQNLINHLSQRRLDLIALQQGYQHQEEQVHIAVLQQFPKISISFLPAKNNGNYYTVGAGVSLSLPIFDQNQGAIALASATRQQLFEEYNNRIFQTQADIAELLSTLQALNSQIQTVQAVLPDLMKLQQSYQRAYQNGQVDVLNYYHAWNNVTDKQLELLTLQQHLIEARIGLEVATGIYDLGKS